MTRACRPAGAAFGCLTLLALAAGCGERKVTVKGRLLENGQPLDPKALRAGEGRPSAPPFVVFVPEAAAADRKAARYRAAIDEAGRYEVQLPRGRYRASVFVPRGSTRAQPPPTEGGPVYDVTESTTLDLEVPRE
jgi:hypothetical protein